MSEGEVASTTFQVIFITAVLLTLPVFYAECWLLICRLTGRGNARRYTIPFAVTSVGSALLALWLAHQIDFSPFLVAYGTAF